MQSFICATVPESEYSPSTGWKPLLPPLHVCPLWPTDAAIYQHVPSIAKTLAELETVVGKELSRCTSVTLPLYVDPQSLEPAVLPNVDPAKHFKISQSFAQLRAEIEESGVLAPGANLRSFDWTAARSVALLVAFVVLYLRSGQNCWMQLGSAVFLGAFWHQTMFIAHDCGHTELTVGCTSNAFARNLKTNTGRSMEGQGDWLRHRLVLYARRFLPAASLTCCSVMGMSLGWWSDQHNTHHLIPNHPEHDPDIQLLPLFAFSARCFEGFYSTYHRAQLGSDRVTMALLSIQQYMFYPIMIFARFSLLGKSYHYLATKAPSGFYKRFEIAGVACFYAWFSAVLYGLDAGSFWKSWALRVAFVLVAMATTCPIHVQVGLFWRPVG